jgi:hypothetical protein
MKEYGNGLKSRGCCREKEKEKRRRGEGEKVNRKFCIFEVKFLI